ncbi:MAG TPA: hypothetical protein VGO27_06085 [Candidatus Acidoferrum sp.]|nr:hypothetical protein [Candidatus Acidoferrum sp.]
MVHWFSILKFIGIKQIFSLSLHQPSLYVSDILAGDRTSDLMRILPVAHRRLRQVVIASVQIVHAGEKIVSSLRPTDFVATPVLPVRAATPGEDAEELADLDQLRPEAIWAAPANGVPILLAPSVFE